MATEHVILVDEADHEIGHAEKLAVHEHGGRLHRAFSIFVFDHSNRLLLQKRADCKYHFAGLWSNTCCGHPRPDETVLSAAARRLREEFGFTVSLNRAAQLVYRAEDPASGLTEHEYLHVLSARFDAAPCPDPNEISDHKWATLDEIHRELNATPDRFTPWFPIALAAVDRND